MPYKLLTKDLVMEFKKQIADAQLVQTASAWMTESGALDALLKQEGCEVQAIIGISGDATTSTSLRSLVCQFGRNSLRIANRGHLFHPKLFLFHRDQGATTAWIGSANFTAHGMGVNTELMLETDDDGVVRRMMEWFEEQWGCFQNQDVEQMLSEYEAKRKNPSPYVGDRGGRNDLLPLPPGTTIQVRPKTRVNNRLHGEIVFGKSDSATYETGIEGLRKLLERLSLGRTDDFFRHCRSKLAFQRGGGYLVAKGRTKGSGLYHPGDAHRVSPQGMESGWWISGKSDSQEKWKAAQAAVEVANDEFNMELVLLGQFHPTKP